MDNFMQAHFRVYRDDFYGGGGHTVDIGSKRIDWRSP